MGRSVSENGPPEGAVALRMSPERLESVFRGIYGWMGLWFLWGALLSFAFFESFSDVSFGGFLFSTLPGLLAIFAFARWGRRMSTALLVLAFFTYGLMFFFVGVGPL